MPDTGSPWNIPYVAGTDIVSDWPTDNQTMANAIADGLDAAGKLNTRTVVTATNATWPVPTLADPVVRVTVIGAGGGGGGANATGTPGNGGKGGSTVFGQGAGYAVTATGGTGGLGAAAGGVGRAATLGFASSNGGGGAIDSQNTRANTATGQDGGGGRIEVAYIDLTGVTTVNIQIGAGGTAGTGTNAGAAGGRGEVIVEYRAG